MKEQDITKILRAIALILLIASGIYLFLARNPFCWMHLLVVWVLFILCVIARSKYAHDVMYVNFSRIAKEHNGNVDKGGWIFFVPPAITFLCQGRKCRVGYVVNSILDPVFEYSIPLKKELELRIVPAQDLGHRFDVSGSDSAAWVKLAQQREVYTLIEALMEEFHEIYTGKDGKLRLIVPCFIVFTEPERVLSVMDKAVGLAALLEAGQSL